MNREAEYKRFFQFTSAITDLFPEMGGRFLDFSFKNLLGNKALLAIVVGQARRKVKKTKKLNRFLVIADLNIGDAVIASSAVDALRNIFPAAEIDLAIKKLARNIVEGNPRVSNLYPVYVGAPYPNEGDLSMLARVAKSKEYDLVINFSPMIEDKIFGTRNVVNFTAMAALLVNGEKQKSIAVNNVSYQAYNFIGKIFHPLESVDFVERFRGTDIYLSDNAVELALNFLVHHGVSLEKPVIMFNPDASSQFTRMPIGLQSSLLKKIAGFDCDILLGAGHVEKFIEYELIYLLPHELRQKIITVPSSVEIDVYAALIDFADIFITGDTGPLHLAASRKFSRESGESLRNRTAVFSIFGGTPPHIYGYDSKTSGFLPANQDAPSRTFISKTPCRNITCINKMAKTCKEVMCFKGLDKDEIISEAVSHLKAIKNLPKREKFLVPEE